MFDVGLEPYVEICGNKKAVIEGCDSLVDFDEHTIKVVSGRLKIILLGKNLKVKILAEKLTVIEGYITSVNFEY